MQLFLKNSHSSFFFSISDFTTNPSTTTGSSLGFVEVSVCDMESDNCTLCDSTPPSEFIRDYILGSFMIAPTHYRVHSTFSCSAEKEIHQNLKLVFPNNKIRPSEIKIYGKGEKNVADICIFSAELSTDLRQALTESGVSVIFRDLEQKRSDSLVFIIGS